MLIPECLHIRVWDDNGDGFVAECVDIPGCMSQGETRKEALDNLIDAISACLEVIEEDAPE